MQKPIVGLVENVWSMKDVPPAAKAKVEAAKTGIPEGKDVALVSFADGQFVYVDPEDEAAEVLESILRGLQKPRRRPQPAYVLPRPGSAAVDRLQLPLVTQVLDTTRVNEHQYEVRLARSAGIYVADTSTPEGQKNYTRLNQAVGDKTPLIVSVDDDDDSILDVRVVDFRLPEDNHECPLELNERTIIGAAAPVSTDTVQEFFAELLTENCEVPRTTMTCLPLHYPDNFCWAIANSVAARLAARRIECGKVWLFGNLRLKTNKRFLCFQRWQFHVAAFVRPSDTEVPDSMLVLDPVVAPDGPLPLRDWQARIAIGRVDRVITDRRVYQMLGRANGFCELPGDTEEDLGMMRDGLRLRARGRRSPPPYDRCS